MRSSIALLAVIALASASGAWAAVLSLADMATSNVAVPSGSVVGSVSPTSTDNALFRRDDRRSDVYYEPDLSVRLNGSVAHDFRVNNVTLSPLLLLTYRFSDLAEARRWRFDAVLGIEVKLDPKWSIVSTPSFEAYWFNDGLNSARQDQLYSEDIGLRYSFASNVSLTTAVLYEVRTSNVAVRRYRDSAGFVG
jgi:hypothetical protein